MRNGFLLTCRFLVVCWLIIRLRAIMKSASIRTRSLRCCSHAKEAGDRVVPTLVRYLPCCVVLCSRLVITLRVMSRSWRWRRSRRRTSGSSRKEVCSVEYVRSRFGRVLRLFSLMLPPLQPSWPWTRAIASRLLRRRLTDGWRESILTQRRYLLDDWVDWDLVWLVLCELLREGLMLFLCDSLLLRLCFTNYSVFLLLFRVFFSLISSSLLL